MYDFSSSQLLLDAKQFHSDMMEKVLNHTLEDQEDFDEITSWNSFVKPLYLPKIKTLSAEKASSLLYEHWFKTREFTRTATDRYRLHFLLKRLHIIYTSVDDAILQESLTPEFMALKETEVLDANDAHVYLSEARTLLISISPILSSIHGIVRSVRL